MQLLNSLENLGVCRRVSGGLLRVNPSILSRIEEPSLWLPLPKLILQLSLPYPYSPIVAFDSKMYAVPTTFSANLLQTGR